MVGEQSILAEEYVEERVVAVAAFWGGLWAWEDVVAEEIQGGDCCGPAGAVGFVWIRWERILNWGCRRCRRYSKVLSGGVLALTLRSKQSLDIMDCLCNAALNWTAHTMWR